jgi:hypothetical protein
MLERLLAEEPTLSGVRIREELEKLGYEGGKRLFDDVPRELRPRFLPLPRSSQRNPLPPRRAGPLPPLRAELADRGRLGSDAPRLRRLTRSLRPEVVSASRLPRSARGRRPWAASWTRLKRTMMVTRMSSRPLLTSRPRSGYTEAVRFRIMQGRPTSYDVLTLRLAPDARAARRRAPYERRQLQLHARRGPLLGDPFCALTRASMRLRRLARHAADGPAEYGFRAAAGQRMGRLTSRARSATHTARALGLD